MEENIKINKLCFDFEGIDKSQISELVNNFNSIDGFKAYLRHENDLIEVKEIWVIFFLEFTKDISIGILSSLITYFIIKFFEKEKSNDEKPITININNIQINQGESLQEIENKMYIIIKNIK